MTVYRRPWTKKSGAKSWNWYWKFTVNGQTSHLRAVNPDNRKQKAETRREAELYEAIARQRVEAGQPIFALVETSVEVPVCSCTLHAKLKADGWTFARFVAERYEPVAKENQRTFTVGTASYLRVLLPVFGDKLIDQISPFEIEQFKIAQRGRQKQVWRKGKGLIEGKGTLSNKSVNLYLDCLSSIFSMAVAEGLRPKNPCDFVRRLEVMPKKKRTISREEEERLIAACRAPELRAKCGHVEAAIVCLVEGGFRPHEFLHAKKEQVNLMARTMEAISYKMGRRRIAAQPKRRVVPISDRALPYYETLLKTEGERLYPYDEIKHAWNSVRAAAGLSDMWLRWLRDTAKQRWEEAGLGAFEIALLMGHSSPQVTMAYSLINQERVLAAMRSTPQPRSTKTNSAPLPESAGCLLFACN